MDTLEKVRAVLRPLILRSVVSCVEHSELDAAELSLPVWVIMSENAPHRMEVSRLLDEGAIDLDRLSLLVGPEGTD
jgi:hypothetical protein